MNEQQYQAWKKELKELEDLPWGTDEEVDWEYVDHRVKMLKADILVYEETYAIIRSADVTEEMDDGEYWNAIALANDAWNGDM